MNENNLEKVLREARLPEIEMRRNRAAVRAVLARMADKPLPDRRRLLKPFFAVGVAVGVALGAVFVLLIQDASANQEVADNLGSTWCTYIDGPRDASDAIWPPSSIGGQNNFVKSAPGYGGKGYAIRFKGEIDAESSMGFMGIGAFLGSQCFNADCGGVTIQKYEKIRFKMKGRISGGELVLQISGREHRQEESDGAMPCGPSATIEYEADITDFVTAGWRTVTLDLRDDFKPPVVTKRAAWPSIEAVLSDARQVNWHVRKGGSASVDVWIDDLEFY
jgi:hypothetical protein